MSDINRRWILGARPSGALGAQDIIRSDNADRPALQPGQIRIQCVAVHCAPTVRNSMGAQVSEFSYQIPLGEPIVGPIGGRVVESACERIPVGTRVVTAAGWQDYSVVDPDKTLVQIIGPGISLTDALGKIGLNSLTAYFGVTRIGAPKQGEVMVVSGAAGSAGSVAAQLGKILGCRVIGIAGTPEKCSWLVDELGLDGAIDYRTESVPERLAELCPDGVDVYFDNVGGQISTDVFARLTRFARVVVCGQIAAYDSDGKPEASFDMLRLIYGAITVRGFVVRDFAAEFDAARTQLAAWIAAGKLQHREDFRAGFDAIPHAYRDLFDGSNAGTLIVVIDKDAAALA